MNELKLQDSDLMHFKKTGLLNTLMTSTWFQTGPQANQ